MRPVLPRLNRLNGSENRLRAARRQRRFLMPLLICLCLVGLQPAAPQKAAAQISEHSRVSFWVGWLPIDGTDFNETLEQDGLALLADGTHLYAYDALLGSAPPGWSFGFFIFKGAAGSLAGLDRTEISFLFGGLQTAYAVPVGPLNLYAGGGLGWGAMTARIRPIAAPEALFRSYTWIFTPNAVLETFIGPFTFTLHAIYPVFVGNDRWNRQTDAAYNSRVPQPHGPLFAVGIIF